MTRGPRGPARLASGARLAVRHLRGRHAVSLTADVVMLVEDARELTAPAALWALPVVLGQLARQIQDRTLAVGTWPPPIRHLAAGLGLAVNTVGRAYRAASRRR